MSRKKMTKTAKSKKVAHRKSKSTATSTFEQMEKNFKSLPSQLAAAYRQETAATKQQASKLSETIKKAEALVKAIQSKCTQLSSAQPTAKTKKQLAAAKRGFTEANQALKAMVSQMNSIQKLILSYASKQAFYSAFGKEYATFEKQLQKKTQVVAKVKKVKATKVKATKPKAKNEMTDTTKQSDSMSHHQETLHDVETPESVDMA